MKFCDQPTTGSSRSNLCNISEHFSCLPTMFFSALPAPEKASITWLTSSPQARRGRVPLPPGRHTQRHLHPEDAQVTSLSPGAPQPSSLRFSLSSKQEIVDVEHFDLLTTLTTSFPWLEYIVRVGWTDDGSHIWAQVTYIQYPPSLPCYPSCWIGPSSAWSSSLSPRVSLFAGLLQYMQSCWKLFSSKSSFITFWFTCIFFYMGPTYRGSMQCGFWL